MNRQQRRFQSKLHLASDTTAKRIVRSQVNFQLNNLTSAFDSATTNEQRVHVANQMEELCNAEIDFWSNVFQEQLEIELPDDNTLLEEAVYHINNFRETIQIINELRVELINS